MKYACKCERHSSYNSAESSWSIQPQASFTNISCSELNLSMSSLFKICLKHWWTISQWVLNRKLANISCWQWFTFRFDHQEEIMMTKNMKIRRYHIHMSSHWWHLSFDSSALSPSESPACEECLVWHYRAKLRWFMTFRNCSDDSLIFL